MKIKKTKNILLKKLKMLLFMRKEIKSDKFVVFKSIFSTKTLKLSS